MGVFLNQKIGPMDPIRQTMKTQKMRWTFVEDVTVEMALLQEELELRRPKILGLCLRGKMPECKTAVESLRQS